MKLKLIFLSIALFLSAPSSAEELLGIIHGKYANIRNTPSVVSSQILARAYWGTALKILDKSQEKTKIGQVEGYWYKVQLTEKVTEGWVFEKYVALEGDPRIQRFIRSVNTRLYYFRTKLGQQVEDLKRKLDKRTAFEQVKKYDTRFLHYMGYRFLAEKDTRALPFLIEFMNPTHQRENERDANYTFTWELLQRLTSHVILPNQYQAYRRWWQRNWGTIKLNISDVDLAIIFKKIQDNETRIYRKFSSEEALTELE